MTVSVRDPFLWYVKVVFVGSSVSSTVYEVMIPFCPSGIGGCQVIETAFGLRTSPTGLIGGDDGTAGTVKKIPLVRKRTIVSRLGGFSCMGKALIIALCICACKPHNIISLSGASRYISNGCTDLDLWLIKFVWSVFAKYITLLIMGRKTLYSMGAALNKLGANEPTSNPLATPLITL